MGKVTFICGIILLFRSTCPSQEIVTTKDGKKVSLKGDFTWEYVFDDTAKVFKYADDAVEVWDSNLELTDVNYSKSVALYLHYQNNTDRKIVGVQVFVSIKNPFGKVVFEHTYDDEVLLQPKDKLKNDVYWHFDDNPFISGEPYDLLWQMAQNGTAKINTKILKVIFSDGTILKSKPKGSGKRGK